MIEEVEGRTFVIDVWDRCHPCNKARSNAKAREYMVCFSEDMEADRTYLIGLYFGSITDEEDTRYHNFDFGATTDRHLTLRPASKCRMTVVNCPDFDSQKRCPYACPPCAE